MACTSGIGPVCLASWSTITISRLKVPRAARRDMCRWPQARSASSVHERISLPQPTCNLFGRPALREQREDRGAQTRVNGELPRCVWLVHPALGSVVRGHRALGDRRGLMASEFTGQGARGGARRSACPMARRLTPAASMRLNSSRSIKLKR